MGHAWSWDLVVSLYTWPSDGCMLKAPGSSWSDLVSFINLRVWLEGLKLIIASLWSSLYSETVPPPCMLGDILIVYDVYMWSDREPVGVSVYSWEPGVCGRAWGFVILTVSWQCQCWGQGDPLWVSHLLDLHAHLGRTLEFPMEFLKPSWSWDTSMETLTLFSDLCNNRYPGMRISVPKTG